MTEKTIILEILKKTYHCVGRILTAENFTVVVPVLGVSSTIESIKMIVSY